MNQITKLAGGKLWALAGMLALIATPATSANEVANEAAKEATKSAPEFVKLQIGHRVHHNFREIVTTQLGQKQYLGDTEFSFEVTAFYPHFAIVDSTHEVVSLSEELKNPAFKIEVYENDELVDETWAFYAVQAPHFSKTSLISFQALAFEYRGTVYDQKKKDEE